MSVLGRYYCYGISWKRSFIPREISSLHGPQPLHVLSASTMSARTTPHVVLSALLCILSLPVLSLTNSIKCQFTFYFLMETFLNLSQPLFLIQFRLSHDRDFQQALLLCGALHNYNSIIIFIIILLSSMKTGSLS